MKGIIRSFVINTAALWAVSQTASGIHFEEGTATLFLAGLSLAIVNLLIRPLINLLLLPLNLITLGTLRWVANVITLYIVTLVVPGFSITGFDYPGFVYQGFSIPQLSLSPFFAYIVISFLISIVSSVLFWLSH